MGASAFLPASMSNDNLVWALVDFAAWCFESEGNFASTVSGKLAAVQYFHRTTARVELPHDSPLLKCALKGIARSHVQAGTRSHAAPGYVENVARR